MTYADGAGELTAKLLKLGLASSSVREIAEASRIEEQPFAFGFACAYSARLGNDPVPIASDAVERELAERGDLISR